MMAKRVFAGIALLAAQGLGASFDLSSRTSQTAFKRLAGSPDEFADHTLPEASSLKHESRSLLYPLDLVGEEITRGDDGQVITFDFTVDSSQELIVSLMAVGSDQLHVRAFPPNASEPLEPTVYRADDGWSIGGGEPVPTSSFLWSDIELGIWSFEVGTQTTFAAVDAGRDELRKPTTPRVLSQTYPSGDDESINADASWKTTSFASVKNTGTQRVLKSAYNNWNWVTGDVIGVSAELHDTSSLTGDSIVRSQRNFATLDILDPTGRVYSMAMHDDGLENDVAANDGIFSAQFMVTKEGSYITEVFVADEDNDNDRTSFATFIVRDQALTLNGKATSHLAWKPYRVHFQVGVDASEAWLREVGVEQSFAGFHIYAEVWGENILGKSVPVAWAGGLVDPQVNLKGELYLPLDVDLEWLKRAHATHKNFVLKNVRIQDNRQGSGLLDSIDRIKVDPIFHESEIAPLLQEAHSGLITEEMIKGPRPQWLHGLRKHKLMRLSEQNATFTEEAVNGNSVMLVHGYCSPMNPWPKEDFTNPFLFSDPNQSRSNDEFAQLIFDYAVEIEMPTFGIVAHSQGGLAAVHLRAFYWSPADDYTGERPIQTMASPFQGTPLTSKAGLVESIFNMGCGENHDLGTEGSTLWQTNIPADVRDDVYFYYVSYPTDAGIGGRYCSMATQTMLANGNDAVVEVKRAPLTGGHDQGITSGQCHGDGMKYPAAPSDHTRNKEMNSYITG